MPWCMGTGRRWIISAVDDKYKDTAIKSTVSQYLNYSGNIGQKVESYKIEFYLTKLEVSPFVLYALGLLTIFTLILGM